MVIRRADYLEVCTQCKRMITFQEWFGEYCSKGYHERSYHECEPMPRAIEMHTLCEVCNADLFPDPLKPALPYDVILVEGELAFACKQCAAELEEHRHE